MPEEQTCSKLHAAHSVDRLLRQTGPRMGRHRDNIDEVFVLPIEATGKATVTDVWKEMGSDSETLDKIFCINPVNGVKLQPTAFTIDKDGYHDGSKPLGDHYPLAATFEVKDSKTLTILPPESTSDNDTKYFSITGHRIAHPRKGLYISKGRKIMKIFR